MSYRILCTDNLSHAGLSELEKFDGLEITFCKELSFDELIQRISNFDALIVRSKSMVTKDVITAGKKLKLIARAGVGVDNIDITAATDKGIFVINAPGGNTISTAEHAFAMMMALSRHIPQAARLMSEGVWSKSKFKGAQIAYKTLGVIGLGRVGREFAKRAHAFHMTVLACDPFLTDAQISDLGIMPASQKDIFSKSDYITIHTPLTKDTQNMITASDIDMMKPDVRIINCARGGIINEADLASALKHGRIAGAALDVYSTEPYDPSLFMGLDNCIMTPHLGASTEEAQDAVATEVARSVGAFFEEGICYTAVNLPQADTTAWEHYQWQIILAEKLGKVASELCRDQVTHIKVTADANAPSLVMLAVIKEILGAVTGEHVSLINAKQMADSHDIGCSLEATISADFQKTICLELISENTTLLTLTGIVQSDNRLLITKYNDFNITYSPSGITLFIQNNDHPGLIGQVCQALGDHQVNIACMQNVRQCQGERALTMITVDDMISENLLYTIRNQDNIIAASLVTIT